MNLRFYRSFSAELMKLAHGLSDEDVRGILKTSGPTFALAAGAHDFSTKNKIDSPYQPVRDYAVTAGKGALTGAAILGLRDKMRGGLASTGRAYTAAIGTGAGLMLADRYHRHRHGPEKSDHEKTAGFVNANPMRAFRSPASQLASSRRTGGFKSRIVRTGLGTPPKVVQLGKKFKMAPSAG